MRTNTIIYSQRSPQSAGYWGAHGKLDIAPVVHVGLPRDDKKDRWAVKITLSPSLLLGEVGACFP